MDIDKAFPSRYLKAADLNGKQVTVIIKEVKSESVGPEQENKLVVYFRGTDKRLVVNQTNCRRIAAVTGQRDTDNWAGKKVTLFVAEVEYKGKSGPAIRVLVPEAAPAPPPPLEAAAKKRAARTKVVEPDDEIPDTVEPTVEPVEEDFDPDDEENIPF